MNTEQLLKEAISSFKNMPTNELEKYIEKRYTEKAPQKELDKLETEFATRVLEEDLNITENDLNMTEGIALEEELVDMYHKYLTPSARNGMDKEDIIKNMRSAIENRNHGDSSHLSDKQILDAAKDAYEYKKNLILKKKRKLFNISPE